MRGRRTGRFQPKLTDEMRAEIVARYQAGESSLNLGEAFGLGSTTIFRVLEAADIDRRRCGKYPAPIRHDAFDEVTEESAYWIGFLMADGCILEPGDGHQKGIKLAISEIDAPHLEAYRLFLGTTKPIERWQRTNPSGVVSRFVGLTVYSDHMAGTLARYGVVPRKSLTAEVSGLEDNRHFWRGAVDGDGCLQFHNGRPKINLVGSVRMVGQFADYVRNLSPLTRTIPRVAKGRKIASFELTGCFAWDLIQHLYYDNSISLRRKQDIADAVLAQPRPDCRYKWTELTRDQLLELHREHRTWKGVAEAIGISFAVLNNVRMKISGQEDKPFGVHASPIRKLTPEQREQIRLRCSEGAATSDLAAEYEVHQSTIQRALCSPDRADPKTWDGRPATS